MGEREREGRREAMGDRDGEGREGKEGHRGGSEDGQGRTRGTPSIPTTCPFKRVLLLSNVLFLTLLRAERDENRRCMVPSAANREGRRKKKIRRVFLNQVFGHTSPPEKEAEKTTCHMLRQTSPFSDAARS